jgi:hypothetical protein
MAVAFSVKNWRRQAFILHFSKELVMIDVVKRVVHNSITEFLQSK